MKKARQARTLRNRVTQFTEKHRTVTVGNNVKKRGSNCHHLLQLSTLVQLNM